ncbi:MAG TPA: BamA/TamA family outer membrane protein, partial [Vicinamibacterales bacterium]|nr:BamA/TamA family outer membrane protein [Vicinamibacterales bacterium]
MCALLFVTALAAAGCKEEGAIKVSSLKFNGTKAVSEKQIKSVLATAASSKLPWGTKRFFSREQFEADLKRITAFYKDRGFPDARVTSFDVQLSDDQTSVDIVINISEGEPLRVEQLRLEGFEPLPAEHFQNLQQRLPLKAGQPLDRALMQASREYALDELRDHGYPYASVRVTDQEGSSDHARIVTLHAQPGTIAYHGPIDISGNSSVADSVIRRQLTFKPGDLYRQSKLRESQRKLYQLEVFDFANVQPLRQEGEQPPEIPTRVTVTEGDHRKVNFSAGYGSEEKARAEVNWRHVNFFGGARTAGVEARYSSLDRGVRLNFREPYFFSPRYSLALTGQSWYTDEPAFNLLTTGGRARITREFGLAGGPVLSRMPAMSLSLTYANEFDEHTVAPTILSDLSLWDDLIALGLDPLTGRGRGQRSALSIDAGRNTTENILDARQGYVATVHLEQAGTWLGGTYDYYEFTGEFRHYVTVANTAVLAGRVRAGATDALGSNDVRVPFFKRYFLGGASSLRGWGRFDVAPLTDVRGDGSGVPVGGHTVMNFSAELRAPIWGNLSG